MNHLYKMAGTCGPCMNVTAFGTVVQITLSESSIPSFSRYQSELNDTARCVAMGIPGFKLAENPFRFFIIREVTSAKGNTWTKLNIKGALPAKI